MELKELRVGDKVSWIDGVGNETIATVIEIPVEKIVVELKRPSGHTLCLFETTPCVKEMKRIE